MRQRHQIAAAKPPSRACGSIPCAVGDCQALIGNGSEDQHRASVSEQRLHAQRGQVAVSRIRVNADRSPSRPSGLRQQQLEAPARGLRAGRATRRLRTPSPIGLSSVGLPGLASGAMRRGTSCTSCRCRTSTGRCARPGAPRRPRAARRRAAPDRHLGTFAGVAPERPPRSRPRGRGRRYRARAGGAVAARVGHAAGARRGAARRERRSGAACPFSPSTLTCTLKIIRAKSRPDAVHQVAEEREGLVLVGDQRVDLGEAAQVDALAQVVHVEQVLAPAFVDDLQQQEALERAHQLLAERLPRARCSAPAPSRRCASMSALAVDVLAREALAAEVDREELVERRGQRRRGPSPR